MAAPVRTQIDLSKLADKPVLRLVPPLPEAEPRPAKGKVRTERKAPRRKPRHRARARVATCSPVIRRRRRVAASVLIGLVVFLGVLGVGMIADAFVGDAVPERTAVVWVEPGETLWDVAERSAPGYDPAAVVRRIHELNEIAGNSVMAGQALQVPFAP